MQITFSKIDGFVRSAEKLQSRAFKYADALNDSGKYSAGGAFSDLELAIDRFIVAVNGGTANRELPDY